MLTPMHEIGAVEMPPPPHMSAPALPPIRSDQLDLLIRDQKFIYDQYFMDQESFRGLER